MISVINGYVFWERFYILIQKVRTGSLREKCPYLKLFWSPYSRIRTEYDEILRTSPYSVLMRKMRARITPNTDTFCELDNSFIPSLSHSHSASCIADFRYRRVFIFYQLNCQEMDSFLNKFAYSFFYKTDLNKHNTKTKSKLSKLNKHTTEP